MHALKKYAFASIKYRRGARDGEPTDQEHAGDQVGAGRLSIVSRMTPSEFVDGKCCRKCCLRGPVASRALMSGATDAWTCGRNNTMVENCSL
jgi:hypothetical protein